MKYALKVPCVATKQAQINLFHVYKGGEDRGGEGEGEGKERGRGGERKGREQQKGGMVNTLLLPL